MAIKKELIGINGERKEYFRIKKIIFDYDSHFFTITCEVYTSEEHRKKAKEKLQSIQMNEEIWYKLQDKTMKSAAEHMILSDISYDEIIQAHRDAAQYILKEEQIQVNVEDVDIRGTLYELLKQTQELKGATDVFENEHLLTEIEINEEIERRLKEAEERIIMNQLPPPVEIERDPSGGL